MEDTTQVKIDERYRKTGTKRETEREAGIQK